jgi:hypothetical protein
MVEPVRDAEARTEREVVGVDVELIGEPQA